MGKLKSFKDGVGRAVKAVKDVPGKVIKKIKHKADRDADNAGGVVTVGLNALSKNLPRQIKTHKALCEAVKNYAKNPKADTQTKLQDEVFAVLEDATAYNKIVNNVKANAAMIAILDFSVQKTPTKTSDKIAYVAASTNDKEAKKVDSRTKIIDRIDQSKNTKIDKTRLKSRVGTLFTTMEEGPGEHYKAAAKFSVNKNEITAREKRKDAKKKAKQDTEVSRATFKNALQLWHPTEGIVSTDTLLQTMDYHYEAFKHTYRYIEKLEKSCDPKLDDYKDDQENVKEEIGEENLKLINEKFGMKTGDQPQSQSAEQAKKEAEEKARKEKEEKARKETEEMARLKAEREDNEKTPSIENGPPQQTSHTLKTKPRQNNLKINPDLLKQRP